MKFGDLIASINGVALTRGSPEDFHFLHQPERTRPMPEKNVTAADRIKSKVQRRWGNEQATLVAIDEVVAEYEPRVAALESQMAKLLAELGEAPKGKGGK